MSKVLTTKNGQDIELFADSDGDIELHLTDLNNIDAASTILTLPELIALGAIIQGLIAELQANEQ